MKEEIKDKLTDLYKIFAILLGIAGLIGMFFIPESIFAIIFYLVVAGLHLWVIYKIIVCYKNMSRSQRKGVMNYILLTVLSTVPIFLAYNGLLSSWVKDESLIDYLNSLGFCGIGYSWVIGLNACKEVEE
ncbi:MAG: hypothetical protein IJK41_07865 [Muribaculaceae bacterium]|nr:hypothetical protein [Muribaculaceae bacterium]